MIGNLDVGTAHVMSATANIKATQGAILGIWVSSASGSPTIAIYDSATTTTTLPIASTFTPVAATFYRIPAAFANGLYIVIGATVSCTIIYV